MTGGPQPGCGQGPRRRAAAREGARAHENGRPTCGRGRLPAPPSRPRRCALPLPTTPHLKLYPPPPSHHQMVEMASSKFVCIVDETKLVRAPMREKQQCARERAPLLPFSVCARASPARGPRPSPFNHCTPRPHAGPPHPPPTPPPAPAHAGLGPGRQQGRNASGDRAVLPPLHPAAAAGEGSRVQGWGEGRRGLRRVGTPLAPPPPHTPIAPRVLVRLRRTWPRWLAARPSCA